jgi:hypothetical protein
VQGTTTGLKNNTTGTVNSTEAGTGTSTASDSLLVLSYPTITKAIAPDPVSVGTPTTVTFTINNPNATSGLNGLNFTDALPAGMTIATPPNQGGTCAAPVFTPALAGGGNAINLCTEPLRLDTFLVIFSSNRGPGLAPFATAPRIRPE